MSQPASSTPSTHPPVADLSKLISQCVEYYQNEDKTDQKQPQQECIIAGTNITFRLLQRDDCLKGYIDLLGQLTKVTQDNDSFQKQFDSLNGDYIIIIAEDSKKGAIIGTGTLLIEKKFIRNFSAVGHIEDIVVDSNLRRCGVGLTIVQTLAELSKRLGCYKSILDCGEEYKEFYEQCGFTEKGLQMGKYF
jgi:glucosamine-phosphate N-acetyltransferase